MLKRIFSALSFILLVSIIHSQDVSEHSIDQLMEEWNHKDRPGVAVVILNKGQIIYQKGFGLADLEYKTPITSHTRFQTAGLSKHFTAFAILLLEEQGKLALDDDVRRYIPALPKYKSTITIRHLLSQSSGLNDYWAVKALAGWREADVFTHEDALQLIYSQKELNFKPGTDFLYANTNLTLLAEVIERASGMSLADYTQTYLFAPLNMKHTFFCDDYEMPFERTAVSYQLAGDTYKKSPINYANAGPTNLYTTLEDMCLWIQNFDQPKVGSKSLIRQLDVPVTLDNGKPYTPPYGKLTYGQQFTHLERGVVATFQTGRLGGYTSAIFRFPHQDFTGVVFSNNGMPYNGYIVMQIAELFVGKHYTKPLNIDFTKIDIKALNTEQLKQHTGYYWNKEDALLRHIRLENDTLRYARPDQNRESIILPLDENTFQMTNTGDDEIIIKFEHKGDKKYMYFTIGESDPYVSETFESARYTEKDLQAFTGTFYCESLNTAYTFSIKEGQLITKHLKNGTTTFKPISKDLFAGDQWFLASIHFVRDKKQMVQGFNVSTSEIKHLWFEKID